MAKLTSKRQITVPLAMCKELGVEPGDTLESFIYEGKITLVKKVPGAAKGILKGIAVDETVSEEESLKSGMNH